ncbi:DNA repair protein RecN [Ketobacter sp.]|uniref:DNA repair protein RecN n=1 Tax=Ketobacter sp. TaxID=2083498 RepID=UPI000F0EEE95|nr:DNA repair protein RecN [Ketobacter sp.]RLT99349.1 MAG: DNA repair protein RecN [Ketobacter sp.]
MLTHINISNFAIVEQLDLDIPNKLTVITGETGAGKSIMIDALGLALGDRAESGSVRHGADKAEILATFDVHNNPDARAWLQSRDLDADHECILRRVVSADGRSRAYINGTPSPVQSLKELGEMLVSIHGQHEHQALLKKDTHRALLDEFAGLNDLAKSVSEAFRHWQKELQAYEHFRDHAKEMQDRADLLRFQINELDELKPQPGELAELEAEHKKLSNVESLLSRGQQALTGLCEGDSTVLDQAHAILQLLKDMLEEDPGLKDVVEMVDSARIQLDEAGSSLRHYLDGLDLDPERYQELDNRVSGYFHLARKHRVDPHQLADLWQELQTELDAIDGGDEKLAKLEKAAQNAREDYLKAAEKLSKGRAREARKLSKLITEKVQPLGMPGAEFQVDLQPLGEEQYNAHGLEVVEFIVRTNPGQPAKPLNKVASGGELSRISLAIQVACAAKTNVATLVFDEVDVGIGGAVAQIVGRLLRELGTDNQVMCVTHLPQVAAQGHTHLHVNKQTSRNQTHTDIAELSQDEKVAEIARMLGGLKITDQTLAHAKELIEESQT